MTTSSRTAARGWTRIVRRSTAWIPILACLGLVAAPPSLEIRREPGRPISLAWPLQPPAVLEVRDSLSPDTRWQESPEAASVVAGWNVLVPAPAAGQRYFRLRLAPARTTTRLAERSPAPGEGGVAVTRETAVRFSRPVDFNVPIGVDAFHATLGDRRLLGRVELAADRLGATLFHLEPLPASARIRVTLDGLGFRDADGDAVDADGDGEPGGRTTWDYDTAPITGVPGTAISGWVLAAETRSGTNVPLAGVTVTVDGAEESLRAVTGPDGAFRLEPSPSGRFFVHVDGRTAAESQWPDGAYYPFVGKAWEAVPGRTNNLANGDGRIYLPRIGAEALQRVQTTRETVVEPTAAARATHPELAGVQLVVPPNALFSDNGQRGGRVGLAAVAPDRLPEPLPPGLRIPLVITIQTDGAMNFDQPVPVRFPNLPDPVTGVLLPPGARTAIWSFNHDSGRWEIAGPAVVSADGRFVDSLPGTGIRQPGWHGPAPASPPRGPGNGPGRSDRQGDQDGDGDDDEDCNQDGATLEAALSVLDCASSLTGLSRWTDAISNFGRNLVDLAESSEAMAEATGTPGFSCERFSTLFGQLNVAGRTLADLARPVVTSADPTRLASAATGCLLSGAQNAARLACASRCANGETDADRCSEMNTLVGDGLGLRQIAEADSAVDAGIVAAELAGNNLAAAAAAHCASGAQRALHGLGPAGAGTEAELRRAVLAHRDSLRALGTVLAGAAGAGAAFDEDYASLQDRLLEPASRWLVEDRVWAGAHYRLSTPGFEFRQRVDASGDFRLPILVPNAPYTLDVFHPDRALFASVAFRSLAAGDITDVPVPVLRPLARTDLFPDRDADGLADTVERVLGSDPGAPDTDGDGTPDGAEVARGEHPSGGATTLDGVVASVRTEGVARDVVEAGARTVAVALEHGPVELFDTTNPVLPVRVGTVRIGNVRAIVAARGNNVVLADSTTGVQAFDLANPRTPTLRWSQPGAMRNEALAVSDRWVFVHRNGELQALDLATGRRLAGRAGVEADHLLWLGDALAAMVAGRLELHRFDGTTFVSLGSVDVPITGPTRDGRTPRLRAVGDVAVLAGRGGTAWLSLADRRAPAWQGSLFEGSPFTTEAVLLDPGAVATLVSTGGEAQILVQDVAAGVASARTVGAHETPGQPTALLLHQGYLYVADGTAGLTVVVQRPLDDAAPAPGAPPPVLGLAGSFTRSDAQEESSPFVLQVTAAGTRPRRVDLFLGEARLGTTRFPFRWEDTAPRADALPSNLVFTARAATGTGLVVTSPPVVIPLVRETVPPRPVAFVPNAGAVLDTGAAPVLAVTLSEPVDPASVNAETLTLRAAGPDLAPGTPDDVEVALGPLEIQAGGRVLRRTITAPLAPGAHLGRLGTSLADLRGNRPSEPVAWTFEGQRQVRWISDADGAFEDGSRWDAGAPPQFQDLAVVDRAGADPVVRLAGGEAFVGGLLARDPFVLASSIYAGRDLRFEGPLTVTNRASLNAQGGVEVRGPSRWTGPGGVIVEAARLVNAGSALVELVGGSGLVVRAPGIDAPWIVNETGGEIELRGGTRVQTDAFRAGARIINGGVIRAVAEPGQTNRLVTRGFENRGTVDVRGGTLELHHPAHLGRLHLEPGSTALLLGDRSIEIRSAPASLIEGGGDLVINLSSPTDLDPPTRFAGNIELGGRLATARASRSVFLGDRVAVGTFDAGGEVQFRGLAVQLGTLVLRGAFITVASGTPWVARSLESPTGAPVPTGGRLMLETNARVTGPATLSSLVVSGTGTLRIDGPVTFSEALQAFESATLELGGSLTRNGPGFLDIGAAATLRLLPSARIDLPPGTLLRIGGALLNEGELRTPADPGAGPAQIGGSGTRGFENRGYLEIRAGGLLGPVLRQTAGRVHFAGGTLDVPALVMDGGTVTGSGDLAGPLELRAGSLAPGMDTTGFGVLRVVNGSFAAGELLCEAPSRLVIDLATPAAHDRIVVSSARLGGTLEVRLAPGATPVLDDEFVVIEGTSLTGTFAGVILPPLPGGRRWDLRYTTTQVRLRVI